MQAKAIDKGYGVFGVVQAVELVKASNPKYEDRYKVTMADGHAFMVGVATMEKQLQRKKLEDVQALAGKSFGFERTEEGYFNLLYGRGDFRAETQVTECDGEPVPERNPNRDFDAEPVPERNPNRDFDAEPVPAPDPRGKVEDEVGWAYAVADRLVRKSLDLGPVEVEDEDGNAELAMPPLPAEALRAVVALTATVHISYKEASRG